MSEFDLDSNPVKQTNQRLYAERVIHGEIYKARPDVHAVVHHHAPAMMPFCIAGVELVPVFHLGATIGRKAPFGISMTSSATPTSWWSSRRRAPRSLARSARIPWC